MEDSHSPGKEAEVDDGATARKPIHRDPRLSQEPGEAAEEPIMELPAEEMDIE